MVAQPPRGTRGRRSVRPRAQSLSPLHARCGTARVREPAAASRNLKFGHGGERDSSAIRLCQEDLRDLQRRGSSKLSSAPARGARARARAELGIPDGSMTYVFVGGGFERKGMFRLLPAFRRGADARAHLIVVGGDKTETRAKSLARELGIGDRVHFLGARDDVRPWYGAADAFVLPTLYDPFPNAALEAMACGLPIIVTFQCGAAELIGEGANGMTCDALDAASLAALLGRLDPVRAREMGVRARETAARFGLEAMAQRLVALYRDLIHDRGA